MTQHTLGPWKIWHSGYANTPFVIYGNDGQNGSPCLDGNGSLRMCGVPKICEVKYDESDRASEYESNARLIAAAPKTATERDELKKLLASTQQEYAFARKRLLELANEVLAKEAINAKLLEALQSIANGNVMQQPFTHIETVHAYQRIARKAIAAAKVQS